MAKMNLKTKILSENPKPMLIRQVERLKRSQFINRIIIATTDNSIDNKQILCLFQLDAEQGFVKEMVDKPVYIGLAMNENSKIRL